MDDLTTRVLAKVKRRKKSGGDRKHGRNAGKCSQYRAHRYHKNKIAKLKSHISNHPNDGCAVIAYEKIIRMV